MKSTLEGTNSRVNEAEQTRELEGWVGEITMVEQKKERKEDSLRNLWTNSKHPKIHIIGVSEGEERERAWENIWRENSWKLP